ncbi:MAG: phosphate ABC transporter permease PstA [Gammaproteobacteria bacterium]|nr:phosphate ABC transporter permease PstA [Gammaproteobacteria bacterium]
MASNPQWRLHQPRALLAERLFVAGAWIAGSMGFLLPVAIIGYLLVNGIGVLSWEFISAPPRGYPLGLHGGILPAIQGSLAVTMVALGVAFPLAVASAIYLAEYAEHPRFVAIMQFLAECLAAVPALLFGVLGYGLLVVQFGLGISALAGGLTLAMMMYPVILIGSHAALQSVDRSLRESALAMGVSRAYVIRRALLPRAWPGIIAATVLAGSHAVGSAVPVLFTAAVVQTRSAPSLDSPVMTLPTHLFYLVSEAVSFEHAYGTAFVLLVCLLFANTCALVLRRRLRMRGE